MANPLDAFDMPQQAGGNPLDAFDQGSPSPAAAQQPQAKGGLWNNLVAGVEGIPGNILSYADAASGNLPGNPLVSLLGLDDAQAQQQQTMAKTQSKIGKMASKVTGIDPEKTPQNNIGDMLARNIGATGPFLAAGIEGGLANTARNLATGAGGILGQTSVQAAGGGPVLQTIGAILGGVATGKATAIPSLVRRAQAASVPMNSGTAYVQDIMNSSGKTPADIRQAGVDAQGKPIIGAEALGRQGITATRALALRPGTTGDVIGPLLDERAEGVPDRIKQDFQGATGIDPDAALGDIQSFVDKGQTKAAPLYDKALDQKTTGKFIGPIQKDIAGKADIVKSAAEGVTTAQSGVDDAQAAYNAETDDWKRLGLVDKLEQAKANLASAQKQQTTAQGTLEDANQRLQWAQKAQADGVNGGVWSPRIQQYLDDPEFRGLMAAGLKIQKREALAQGKDFNPSDYALQGIGDDGTPIINGVPNMRLLDTAKRGYDAMINQFKNPNTGRLVFDSQGDLKSILDAKKSYLNELDNLNSDYKAARATSADYLSAQDAFDRGQSMGKNLDVSAKQFQGFVDGLGNDTLRDAAKSGFANWLFNQAQKGALTGKMFSRPILQQKLTGVVGDPDKAAAFLAKMNAEAQMAKSGARMNPGMNSTTMESQAAASNQDNFAAAKEGAGALHSLFSGHPVAAAFKALGAAAKAGYSYSKTPGMSTPVRNAAGQLMMMSPNDLASHLENYGASQISGRLAKPNFPRAGLLPALSPLVSGQSYLGDNQ